MDWSMAALDGVRQKTLRKVAPVRDRLYAAFDPEHFFAVAISLGGEQLRHREPIEVYLSAEKFRTLSPNRYFDEIYYRKAHPDVAQHVYEGVFLSGLHHYVAYGAAEGRMPNPDFERRVRRASVCHAPVDDVAKAETMLAASAEMTAFLRHFPFIDTLDFYNAIGRFISADDRADFRNFVDETLDAEHYVAAAGLDPQAPRSELVNHYVTEGWRAGLSPRSDFDEAFYLSFYDDVRDAVEREGRLRCGYEHWFVAGRREGRLPRHDLQATLEARFAGITQPVGLSRADDLAAALRPPPVREVARQSRVLHVLVPDLNPDIFFGGYQSLVELLKYLRRHGVDLSIIKTARDIDGLDYFLYHMKDPDLRALFEAVPATGRDTEVEVGPNDRFLAYSGWDALRAQSLLAYTDCQRFSYLVQEYEPIFVEHNSTRFLLASAYATPHFAIFNSSALKTYFLQNCLGVFAGGEDRPGDYTVFEHVLTAPVIQAAHDDAPPRRRTFFVYARPEAHAGRNLFEVAVLALRAALERVELRNAWDFVGAGALSELPDVSLTAEHTLKLKARMAREDYAGLIARTYAGLSLMYAPHPSLVPFELAQNGAIVVTNVYSNRDVAFFRGISENIVPADLTLKDITERLVDALRAADAMDEKAAGRLSGPWSRSWDEVCAGIATRLGAEDLI